MGEYKVYFKKSGKKASPSILPRIPLPPVPSPPNLSLSETRDLLNDAGMKGNSTESSELRPQAALLWQVWKSGVTGFERLIDHIIAAPMATGSLSLCPNGLA